MDKLYQIHTKLVELEDITKGLWLKHGKAIYHDPVISKHYQSYDKQMNDLVKQARKVAYRCHIALPKPLPLYKPGGRCLKDCGLREFPYEMD